MSLPYKWTVILSILGLFLLIIILVLMGGGHGYYVPAMVMFPLSMWNIIFQSHLDIPLLIIGLFEYPMAGYLLDTSKGNRQFKLRLIVITLFHFCLVLLILIFKSP